MKFTTSIPNLFSRLEEIPIESEKNLNKKFGVVGLNQYEQCCHLGHIYENKYRFQIWSKEGEGTIVTIRIPAIVSSETEK